MKVINRFKYIYHNQFCFLVSIISLCLTLTQIYNYHFFDDWTYLIRGLGLFFIPISCLLFYEKGVLIYGSIMATVFLYLTDFNNYTSLWFILACNSAAPNKRKSLIVYIWYATNSLLYFTFCQSALTQALFHLGFSALMVILNYHCNNSGVKEHKSLSLTTDEYKILMQMTAEGKQQKEINLFSQTTITQKLKDAKSRNNIPNTDVLLVRFILENNLEIETLIESKQQ